MKRVLITGASGFIGRHALPFLKARGFEIFAISSKPVTPLVDGVNWMQCDLFDPTSTKACVASVTPSHLLHLAWNATPCKFWTDRNNLDWLKASIDLIEFFALQGGKRVVAAGTCAEYDWSQSDFSEKSVTRLPHTLYGTCKLSLHLILETLAKQMGFSQAWGRIFYLYGAHEYPQRFVPLIINGLLKKESVPCSHGQQLRDFLHVEDVAEAFVTLLDSDVQGAMNIASGQAVTLKQVIERISGNLGGQELIQFGARPAPANEPLKLVADVTRLKNELNWHPKITLEEGLNQTISWWRETCPR